MSHNQLASGTDIEELAELTSIQTIDLQYNLIVDVGIVDVLSSLKDLRVLYLVGNPVVKSIKNYRRILISRCKNLKYLDDRPVFDDERRRVEVWMAAYIIDNNTDTANQAERNELLIIRQEKDDADERNFNAFKELMQQGLKSRIPQDASDIDEVAAPDRIINNFSGEVIIDIIESDALREARENRLADTILPAIEEERSVHKCPNVIVEQTGLIIESEETKIIAFGNCSIKEESVAMASGATKTRFCSLLAQSVAELSSEIIPLLSRTSVPQSMIEDEVIDGGLNWTDLVELD